MERDSYIQGRVEHVMRENIDKWFDLRKIISRPSVVVDLTVNEFWITVLDSSRSEEVVAKVNQGEIVPINAEVLTLLTQTQALWHACLFEEGKIPMVPTFVNLSVGSERASTTLMQNEYLVPILPNIYVKKQSVDDNGAITSHGAAGVSIVKTGFLGIQKCMPRHAAEFLQPFVRPQTQNGETFVRDARVFIVGGEPVAGIVRRAREPLTSNNLNGFDAPTINQIYSARARGPRESLTEPLRTKVFDQAIKVKEILEKKIRSRENPFSRFSPIGFMSLDFLIDANGTPLPVDCDIQPWVDPFENTSEFVAEKLANYARKLANLEGKEKQVVIIGPLDEPFTKSVYKETKKLLGKSRTVYQESLMSRAIRTIRGS